MTQFYCVLRSWRDQVSIAQLVVGVVVARDFPGVSPCRSELGGGVGDGSSRPPSRSCQRAGFLVFAPAHHSLLQERTTYVCLLHFTHGLAQ